MKKEGEGKRVDAEARLAEVLASGGLNYDRVSLEVLYLLPEEFVNAYVELYYKALEDPGAAVSGTQGTTGGAVDEGKLKKPIKNRGDRIFVGRGGGKKYRTFWLIRSDKWLGKKKAIDRKLVRLVPAMRAKPGGEDNARCDGCGKFTEVWWKHCAFCGHGLKEEG